MHSVGGVSASMKLYGRSILRGLRSGPDYCVEWHGIPQSNWRSRSSEELAVVLCR